MCKGMCDACPFAYTDYSEGIQNLGCLPEPHELLTLKRDQNINWACHEDESKPCVGFVIRAHELGLDYKQGPMTNLSEWNEASGPWGQNDSR
jgi:hypothetical protein